jgi:predicted RNA-binding Zn-ribbon protein involved in translation (DUF1610 family)
MYWWLVELPFLLPRWENKEVAIESWMTRDRALDKRLANARPRGEPICSFCGQLGLRLVTKELLRKPGNNEQSVLFMFDCIACKKRSVYWEDGTEWVSPKVPCPQCGSPLIMDVKVQGVTMTTTNTCKECGHVGMEKVSMGEKRDQQPDADFERDKALFCLSNERAKTLQVYRPKWEEAMRMMDGDIERAANEELFRAASQIKRVNIPQIIDALRSAIDKAGYAEVAFDKPELGSHVTIEFSCMDKDPNREDAKSRKVLKQAVVSVLQNTNWGLITSSVAYRLGYLSGKIRAYEKEKDILDLLKKGTL